MSEKPADYGQEVRDTVVKSSLTGVAATVLAVTVFSPAGLGGMVGTSVASGMGLDANLPQSAEDPYASLPPYPAPLTADEVSDIHDQLARVSASLEITRAATEAKIQHIRTIAVSGANLTFTPVTQTAQIGGDLRLRTSEPERLAAAAPAPAVEAQPQAQTVHVSYAGPDTSYRDRHSELAELLLAHETF